MEEEKEEEPAPRMSMQRLEETTKNADRSRLIYELHLKKKSLVKMKLQLEIEKDEKEKWRREKLVKELQERIDSMERMLDAAADMDSDMPVLQKQKEDKS